MDFKKNPKTKFKDVEKLSEEEARREIEALREGIEYHNYLYYVKNRPQISDAVYDKLFKRLHELEEAFPTLQSGRTVASILAIHYTKRSTRTILKNISVRLAQKGL